jgi:predicted site-specific integrase-resolvase
MCDKNISSLLDISDDFCGQLGVASLTLRRHAAEGKPPGVRGVGNRRIFQVSDIDALKSKVGQHKAVGYARVSSGRQLAGGDLDRQVARRRSAKTKRLRTAVAAEMRGGDVGCGAA